MWTKGFWSSLRETSENLEATQRGGAAIKIGGSERRVTRTAPAQPAVEWVAQDPLFGPAALTPGLRPWTNRRARERALRYFRRAGAGGKAPKGRNNVAQANGLGLDYSAIFPQP